MQRKLTKYNVIGNRAIFYFKKPDGTVVRDIRTEQYFNSLAGKGSATPEHPNGYEYLYGELCPKYDTPDGDLPDDAYAVLPDSNGKKIAVRLKEFAAKEVCKELVYDATEVGADGTVEIIGK